MTIKKENRHGRKGWRVRAQRLVNDKPISTDKTFDSYKEASAYETKWLNEVRRGIVNKDGNQKWGDYARLWLQNLIGVSEKTRESYEYKVKNVMPHLKHHKLKEINNSDIKRVMRMMWKDGYSRTTMQHAFKVIKATLDQALLDGIIVRNPCSTFKKTTNMTLQHTKEPRALSKWDQNIFVKNMLSMSTKGIYEHGLYAFSCIALYTGMRRGEIACLEWEDIDLDNHYIGVSKSATQLKDRVIIKEPKTKAGYRKIKIDQRLRDILVKYKAAHKRFYLQQGIIPIYNWVFPTPNNEMQKPNLWSHRINDYMKKWDIDHTLHDLRHTHASNLLMYNFPLTELSMRLGHADPQITLRVYSHFVTGMESDIDKYMTQVGT